jgi:acyl-CoA synthetase (AMP-forming)/AMP-acid ligase II
MLVHEFLERSAQSRPDSLAILHGDEGVTYGAIERGANGIAHALLASGIRPDDRVGLLVENSRFYVESFFGVLKAGAIVVPLNHTADARTLRGMLHDCSARGLIAGPRFVPLAEELRRDSSDLSVVLTAELGAGAWDASSPPAVTRSGLNRAAIIYTSGSTGHPKGAILRHENIVSNAWSIVEYLNLGVEDRVLVVLPFFYVYGQSLLTTHVAVGGSLVIENRFLFPSAVVDTLENSEATGFAGVPSTFAILLNKTSFAKRSFPSLRYVTQAGGAMAPVLTRELIKALPGKRIFIMYGATEASARLAYMPPEALEAHVGSIGRAIPDVELRVMGEDGIEVPCGEVGEIVARGPNIMEGYWNDPEETARVLDADGYHTGDLARRDEEGYLWIVGRKRDMIKTGAQRISPKEIEEALLEHPGIVEAAVIGVPDDILGEAIEAHIVPRPSYEIDIAELELFARERLPAYKVPHRFVTRTDLPKSAAGKILKESLRLAGKRN